jgi:hypothetical protein
MWFFFSFPTIRAAQDLEALADEAASSATLRLTLSLEYLIHYETFHRGAL